MLFFLTLFLYGSCSSSKKEKPIDPDEYPINLEIENKITTCKQVKDSGMVVVSNDIKQIKTALRYHTVEIKQMKFQPFELTVQPGDTIVWINRDITTHDVTDKRKTWTSSPLPFGKSWHMIVENSADYYCSLHEVMKGKIIVE